MARGLNLLGLAVLVVAGGAWLATGPSRVDSAQFAGVSGDAAQGASVFLAAGCASCHHAPDATKPEDMQTVLLSGGQAFASDFGTFYAPNISTHPEHGIGAWSLTDFANAVTRGVAPDGSHYYPAFPYTSYIQMRDDDVADLWAYMQTLPADATPSRAHDVGFPFNIRRSVGAWKRLFLSDTPILTGADETGTYLVEALAHCAECHTPRNALGALDKNRWMAGAPNPSGRGTIPALTPDALTWAAEDIAYYLETGFTPDFDSAGGHMAAVISNFSRLTAEDRNAVAAYVKALPTP